MEGVKRVDIIGAPLDLGAGRRGVDMGPSAFRLTGLATKIRELGREVEDLGDVDVPIPESCDPGDPRKKYAAAIGRVCAELAARTARSVRDGHLPLVLGGDHSLAAGSVAGVARTFVERGSEIGLLWIDAHGDMNTPESSPSGNVHGMPLAAILGRGPQELLALGATVPFVSPRRTAIVGVRSLDMEERERIRETGVTIFTMKEIDREGISDVVARALEIAGDGSAGIHLSFDMDSVDPAIAPGVGTPVRGGLDYREAHLAMEMCADSGRIVAIDVVEVNPILDTRNATAELGTELILSALGKRIL